MYFISQISGHNTLRKTNTGTQVRNLKSGPEAGTLEEYCLLAYSDGGFHSVFYEYVLLPLVKKEADSAYGRAKIQLGRKNKLHAVRKRTESGRYPVATQEGRCGVTNHKPYRKI